MIDGALATVSPDTVAQNATPVQPGGKDPKEAAKQFEGMLMANLFQQLRKTVHHTGLFGDGGSAIQTYEYLLDQAVVTQAMDGGRTWGLQAPLEDSIRRAQGK